jgi:iron(III) transport system permease protein
MSTITTGFHNARTAADTRVSGSTLPHPSVVVAVIITLVILLPIGTLALEILNPSTELWSHMWRTFLPDVMINTLWLTVGVGVGTFIIGAGMAWLLTAYEFPGRRWFDHLMLLPLAVPTFVMGFVFLAIFEYAGPVQTQWRAWFGSGAWFPNVYSRGGVIVVMTLVLYPYVYILSRAAFREQAAVTFEAARVMGYSRKQTFFRLVLPLARPSIAAGVILAMMEALTDFGAVQFFDYPTLSERVVVLWNRTYDYGEATQLAGLLLIVALCILVLEQTLRGKARFYQQGGSRGRRMARFVLHGWKKYGAVALCSGLLGLAFALPVIQLIAWAIEEFHHPSLGNGWHGVYGKYIGNSVLLAGVAALLVTGIALIIAYSVRAGSRHSSFPRMLARLVTLGYAMPGAVIAVGVLTVVNPLDGRVTDFVASLGRTNPNYLLTGTIIALSYAYLVRFMAVGYNSVESSMEKVKPSMEQAARTLGATPFHVMMRIHVPLVSTGMAAGAILVFVDVMKELPATLLLRPFAMDTLALWTYFLAHESFWRAAAIPSLTIVVVGLIPVFILMRIGDNSIDRR